MILLWTLSMFFATFNVPVDGNGIIFGKMQLKLLSTQISQTAFKQPLNKLFIIYFS